jgi:hypothetical protein
MEEKIGNIAAAALLGFFLDEIGPLVYNRPSRIQERLRRGDGGSTSSSTEEEFDYLAQGGQGEGQ